MNGGGDRRDVDPVTTCLELVTVDISRIRTYERNPRRSANPDYDRIKASIRADGLGQPLMITQRPGESDYLVHAGGNTRLRILKELFDETGDLRFTAVPCVIRPWTREVDVLLAHLKENDLRGELTFLDKALAIDDVKRFLNEGAEEPLTQSRLAEVLQQCGYGLSQGLVSQMAYTVERLRPLMPQALEAGIGRPQIAKIRLLDRTARATWLERGIDTETEYDRTFEALCRRYDAPEWDIAQLRRGLEAEIADRADISIHAVSLAIEMRLSGRQGDAWKRQASEASEPNDGAIPRKQAAADTLKPGSSSAPDGAPSFSQASDAMVRAVGRPEPATGRAGEEKGKPELVAKFGTPDRMDLKSLRARLWTLASRLAQRNGLGDLVQPLSNRGLGFVLHGVPDPALTDQLDEESLAQVSMVWWYLAACAELTVAPLDALLPSLPEGSLLRRALVDQDAGLLFASVWTLDPGHMGYQLWRRLDDRDWQDLLSLMDTYRTLRRNAATDDQALWSLG